MECILRIYAIKYDPPHVEHVAGFLWNICVGKISVPEPNEETAKHNSDCRARLVGLYNSCFYTVWCVVIHIDSKLCTRSKVCYHHMPFCWCDFDAWFVMRRSLKQTQQGLKVVVISCIVFAIAVTVALIITIAVLPPQVSLVVLHFV